MQTRSASDETFDTIQAAFEAREFRVESIECNSSQGTWTVVTGTLGNFTTFTNRLGSNLFRSAFHSVFVN